ncbi:hypothetical protein OF829_11170 [Sphingomonas sp. LB-2]|uniref:hypothetical protein n=1 Tax=Sphingomonas caeni TaxID=2984949 RepID=UPI002232996B|nr:hypothetical protein [Sphingomonas caeni]MCW3847800.1 hypothetical protein [Sphingomonas caeni]
MRAAALALALIAGGGCSPARDMPLNAIADEAATGNPEGIVSAVSRLKQSGTRDAETLQDALGRAMQVAPDRVLPLVGTSEALAPRHICLPLLDPMAPPHWAKEQIEASRKAIEGVRDPSLAKPREACLAEVNSAATALDRGEEE